MSFTPAKLTRALRRRHFTFSAEPLRDVKSLGTGRFETTGYDGTLLLRAPALPRGWVKLDFEAAREGGSEIPPLLYVDDGHGFQAGNCMRLPPPRQGRIQALVRLPQRVLGLRFHPLSGTGTFTLGRLRACEVSASEAGVRLGSHLLFGLLARPGRLMRGAAKAWSTFKRGGVLALRHQLLSKSQGMVQGSYAEWHHHYGLLRDDDVALIRQRISQLPRLPRISVVMLVRDQPGRWLRLAVESVQRQLYSGWELLIVGDPTSGAQIRQALEQTADDARVRAIFPDRLGGSCASSNDALALATGEWILFLDPRDELAPHALYLLAEELAAHPDLDLVYSDEDRIDEEGRHFDPHFKPEWNPELLSSWMYLGHMIGYRSSLVLELGGFRAACEGAEHYDLCLRASARARRIGHIPEVLYHARRLPESSGTAPEGRVREAALLALRDHHGPLVEVAAGRLPGTFRVRHPIPSPPPLVSIIIPTRDGLPVLRRAVQTVIEKTRYPSFEILIVDNQSREPQTFAFLEELTSAGKARVLRYDAPFNYSAINNMAVREARGELICLLNNDVEVIAGNWLEELVSHAVRPGIGAVGAKLLYADGSVQHAGILLGLHGAAGHVFRLLHRDHAAYFGRPQLLQAIGGVTAACLVIRKETLLRVGGLDEAELKVAFNDVDLCLKLLEAGLRNVYCPAAELYHHESVSRGPEDTPEKKQRERHEIETLIRRWGEKLLQDPAHNPNLSLQSFYLDLAFPPRTRKPWKAP